MKLTLRELFLLVVIAAMGCGWWVDHRRANSLAEKEAQRYQDLRRISRTWENRADSILRNDQGLENDDKIIWNDLIDDRPPYYVVASDSKEYQPGPGPMERRLFRLIAIMESNGFRINFQPRRPGEREGDEEILVEEVPREK